MINFDQLQNRLLFMHIRPVLKVLNLCLLSSLLSGGYLPPDKGSEDTTKASGTRGCPVPLGELYLVGDQLETRKTRPILLFWVNPASSSESLLVVVKDGNARPVFAEQIIIQEAGYYPLALSTDIKLEERYSVTAGLLCQEEINNAVVLETTLKRVRQITTLDRRIEEILVQEASNL